MARAVSPAQARIDALMLLDDGVGAFRDAVTRAKGAYLMQGVDADDVLHFLSVLRQRFLDSLCASPLSGES